MSGNDLRPLAVITISSGLGEGPKTDVAPPSVNDVSGVVEFPNPDTTLFVTVVAVTLSRTMTPRPL